ncbi:MAG: lipoate--protein ligase family protein [Prevotella sp.]|nr:lipoate--protein ligase family protein [Prevotella sp.]
MKYISLPSQKVHRLSFYLAMEEYVARHLDEPEAFFMWQVEPSVIFGRNQVAENEVNVAYCLEHGIKVYRRKSGGGCVYADMDNVMLSYVSDGDSVGVTFNRFVQMILLVLRKMGIEATGTAHNDIMISDKKVCGTAFYQLPGRSIVHSTLLYDTNMEHMLNAITPSTDKLQKKGIQSVRQRITLLKNHTQLTLEEVKILIRDTLCIGERMLTSAEVAETEAMEENYLRKDFINLIL